MKYSLLVRINHWVMVFLIIGLLGMGLWMTGLADDYPGKYDYYGLHKSFGMVALFYIIFRLSIRLRSQIPELPAEISKRDSILSAITVFALYICMFMMPLSGYLMSSFGGYPVSMFGISVPSIVDKNPELGGFFHSMHVLGGQAFIGIIVLHLLGTIKHLVVEKVNLLKRIW